MAEGTDIMNRSGITGRKHLGSISLKIATHKIRAQADDETTLSPGYIAFRRRVALRTTHSGAVEFDDVYTSYEVLHHIRSMRDTKSHSSYPFGESTDSLRCHHWNKMSSYEKVSNMLVGGSTRQVLWRSSVNVTIVNIYVELGQVNTSSAEHPTSGL